MEEVKLDDESNDEKDNDNDKEKGDKI